MNITMILNLKLKSPIAKRSYYSNSLSLISTMATDPRFPAPCLSMDAL